MSDRSRGYALRIEVAAPPARLWQALTDPALLTEWYAREARVDARTGGSYRVRLVPNLEREARIDLFQPPNRLRLIYLPSAQMPAPDGVIVDDFILDDRNGVTHLCLLGSGFPRAHEHAEFHRQVRDGWTRALARLKILTERGVAAEQRMVGAAL
jgi:uncharacterized protein YndB with AHSA1/START domain